MERFRSILVLVLAILAPSTAHADPFVVTAGSFALDFEGEFFSFAGTGFTVGAGGIGLFIPKVRAETCTLCRQGDLVNPGFRTPGEVLLGCGNARFGDTTFSDIAFRGTLAFDVTPARFPASTENVVGLKLPFLFTGSLRGFEQDRQVFAADFIGGGDVFQSFLRDEDGRFRLDQDSRVEFFFTAEQPAPIPEPASVLLLGSGLAGTIVARQRRRRERG